MLLGLEQGQEMLLAAQAQSRKGMKNSREREIYIYIERERERNKDRRKETIKLMKEGGEREKDLEGSAEHMLGVHVTGSLGDEGSQQIVFNLVDSCIALKLCSLVEFE